MDEDAFRLTGVVGCFLDEEAVKRDSALPGGTTIQCHWEAESHDDLLLSCAAAKRHHGGKKILPVVLALYPVLRLSVARSSDGTGFSTIELY
jgi:hypothetical protein